MRTLITICVVAVLTGTAAAGPVFQGFETDTGFWVFVDGGAVSGRVPSGGGVLQVPSASGAYHCELGNVHNSYQVGYGYAGWSYQGGSDPVYQGSFYQAIDVYIDPTWSGLGFWIDMIPMDTDGTRLDAAEANFRLTADGSSVTVQAINSSFLTTINTAGWYTFEIVWSKGANPTDLVNIKLTVYDSTPTELGSETLLATFPYTNHPGESQYLGNHGLVWIPVWENGFAGDVIAIDNVRTGLLCAPVSIVSLTEGPMLVAVNTVVSFEATIADGCGEVDALWDFDDGCYDPQEDVAGPDISSNHTYTSAGIYNVVLSLSDDTGEGVAGGSITVVVYDPSGGFVTGGGWIMSPGGAYTPDPLLTGKANFGFVSKYKKGASEPTGQTEFVFKAGDLNFHSSSYQWLVVAGPHAKFKGDGTINGDGGYGFMLTATDGQINGGGDVDKFRIKIWDKADDSVVYDNQVGDADKADATDEIEGGSIVIHTGKK